MVYTVLQNYNIAARVLLLVRYTHFRSHGYEFYRSEYRVVEFIRSKNSPLNNLSGNFTEVIITADKVNFEDLVVVCLLREIRLYKHRVRPMKKSVLERCNWSHASL